MSHDQLVMALQAEIIAYDTHRSPEHMQALQAAAAACRAAGIDVATILQSTLVALHGPDEIVRRIRAALTDPPPTITQRLAAHIEHWTQRHSSRQPGTSNSPPGTA